MTIVLDGGCMTAKEEAHAYLAQRLHFPDWYGGNLDALYDLLTERGDPTRLIIYRREVMEEALGNYAQAFFKTLADAAGENSNLEIAFDGE